MVECDESKMEQEQQLSAGPRAESAATIGPAIEEPSALKKQRLALARGQSPKGS